MAKVMAPPAVRRYFVEMRVADSLPRHDTASERVLAFGITHEEASAALLQLQGLPVTIDFCDEFCVGTVLGSALKSDTGEWTVLVALTLAGKYVPSCCTEFLRIWPNLAPAVKLVHGTTKPFTKAIMAFSFVRGSIFPGSNVISVKEVPTTFTANM